MKDRNEFIHDVHEIIEKIIHEIEDRDDRIDFEEAQEHAEALVNELELLMESDS